MSNGTEDNAKSVEVGTCKMGHWSDLIGGQSSARAGEFWKTKCDITLRLVKCYACLNIILYAPWCNAHVCMCSACVQSAV